jgi:N-formylglutamate deformylase
MNTFELHRGTLPVLISMPHNGTRIPPDIAGSMTESALKVVDTDWYLDRLYHFAQAMGCSVICPFHSRYVIDLNRPEDNQSLYPGADTTELCPTSQFDRQPIYQAGKSPDSAEIQRRIEKYWRPYHQQLSATIQQLKAQFGYVLLFEAHSIKSMVPRFFDGQLPDFNFGNFDQKSSSAELSACVESWRPSGYSKVFNGRFKGGYITRHYGQPRNAVDTLQLELSQATYLNEETLEYDEGKASRVIVILKDLIHTLCQFSQTHSKRQS